MEPSLSALGGEVSSRVQLLCWTCACCSAPKWSDHYLTCLIPYSMNLSCCPSLHITQQAVKGKESQGLQSWGTTVAEGESWLHSYMSTGENRSVWKESKSTWRSFKVLDYRSLWHYWTYKYARGPGLPYIFSPSLGQEAWCGWVRKLRFPKRFLPTNRKFWFSRANLFNSYRIIYWLHRVLHFNIDSFPAGLTWW